MTVRPSYGHGDCQWFTVSDDEDEFKLSDTSQDLPDQDSALQDEQPRHLSQLEDSINLAQRRTTPHSPSPRKTVSNKLNELLRRGCSGPRAGSGSRHEPEQP